MQPFATYITRFHAARLHALEEHWTHHKPLCLNGVVSLDHDSWTQEKVRKVEKMGLGVLRHPEGGNFDKAMGALEKEGNLLRGGWFLSLDSDEYIPPHEMECVALAAERNTAFHDAVLSLLK